VRQIIRASFAFAAILALSACGSTSQTTSTFDGPDYAGPALHNMLVIGVADSYNNRADFERTLANEIRSAEVSATPYYSLVEMNSVIDRAAIENLVQERGFDSVLITRVLDRDIQNKIKVGTTATKVIRKDGSNVGDLFRYDYEELNDPVKLSMELDVGISSELFSVETGGLVWAIESDISDETHIQLLIVDAVEIVSRKLRGEGFIPK